MSSITAQITSPKIQLQFNSVREHTENICKPLQTEDYVVQPIVDVSPPKWHLGHTTWFFEEFILAEHLDGYQRFNSQFGFVFNSYYEGMGKRIVRTNRGNLSRPTVKEVYDYRRYIDLAMEQLLKQEISKKVRQLIIIGLNHEQQHQELLLTDIKYILGNNPLLPVYDIAFRESEIKTIQINENTVDYYEIEAGIYDIGHQGIGFCFDNELGRHKVYLHDFKIASQLVTNRSYLKFIKDGGYQKAQYWHSEGWEWVKTHQINAPMYWFEQKETWLQYTLGGLQPLDLNAPVAHISYYEAFAYAQWAEMRLPTEFEWEVANEKFDWGKRWEWTESAYLPYPGYKKEPGALGEYNGKFMVSQKVLRGGSIATPIGHSRATYRNFFQPSLRWQFTGLRLAK